MRRRLLRPGCALVALLAAATIASAMPVSRTTDSSRPAVFAVEQVTDRHRVRHPRHRSQPRPGLASEPPVPTGGGDYGGPDSAFPVGENSPVRPGGSYAVTAPIGSPAREIQKQRQNRLCRDYPEVC